MSSGASDSLRFPGNVFPGQPASTPPPPPPPLQPVSSADIAIPPDLSKPFMQPVVAQPPPAARPRPVKVAAKNNVRETVETVAFVVVLVLLLKTFIAEAFVIPTGSMAETLYGYQKITTCSECGTKFPVNCSEEVDPQMGRQRSVVVGCVCPNCRFHESWIAKDGKASKNAPTPGSGDRVLVAKFPYEIPQLGDAHRWDVVVFKYPETPQREQTALNYIKRLIGLPGETIAVCNGDLYVNKNLDYPAGPEYPRPERPQDTWQKQYMYTDTPMAVESFRRGEFEILRKSPKQILAMRRLVYDNDHQAGDLVGKVPPRWAETEGGCWTPNEVNKPNIFRQTIDAGTTAWLRYRHLTMPREAGQTVSSESVSPKLITNFMGYNSQITNNGAMVDDNQHWVGDLILEATIESVVPRGELTLELSKGPDRFQARFNFADGSCTLVRKNAQGETELGKQPGVVPRSGKYDLRFANVDERLTLWVNESLTFGDGVTYPGSTAPGPDEINDKQPASIGVHGAGRVVVRNLKIHRDTFYTGHVLGGGSDTTPVTRYVQPGHYLCLGDNSTQSSDGRQWGTVPQRLMLGRAMVVYFPFWPFNSVNRAGFIQ